MVKISTGAGPVQNPNAKYIMTEAQIKALGTDTTSRWSGWGLGAQTTHNDWQSRVNTVNAWLKRH
jgi:hypothetical protein